MTNFSPSNSEVSTGFGKLAEPVRRWIWNKEWQSLHDVQERAILSLLDDDRDLIIAAATAGGKTEAAFLPLISAVLETPGKRGFDLVYIGPLRALINDQFERLEELCEMAELPVHRWHGDVSGAAKARARRVARGVLLITPESLEALFVLRGRSIEGLFADCRAIVVDELHAFLDNERGVHLRSLLCRLELAVGRRIRRVGLSATLGEMSMVREYLRPEAPENVEVLESTSDSVELRVQVRGYREQRDESGDVHTGKAGEVAEHLFQRLRGNRNLIFAGSRQNVEWYADKLRELSEVERLPVEFFPHHASLSREHRLELENRIKNYPTISAVCTSTLELGIDIGDIACVAQIGAPFSVSSLRQRLGRSGRRAGQPAVLRLYAIEPQTGPESHPIDRLFLRLVRSVAMVELLIERWCEPPAPQALHLSTLTQQILSVIVEQSGVTARRLYDVLCAKGPFRRVEKPLFAKLLKHIGSEAVALIEQAPDGTLLLGRKGEKLVGHHTFYAVFQTPEEYRIIADGKSLGSLPITFLVAPGMTIIFSGRRWRVTEILDHEKIIAVTADRVGTPPRFGGDVGLVHDRVVDKMREILRGDAVPRYLDQEAAAILGAARDEFRHVRLDQQNVFSIDIRRSLLATWTGTVKTASLALVFGANGYDVMAHDGFLELHAREGAPPIFEILGRLARSEGIGPRDVLSGAENFRTEKYHPYLSLDLLVEDIVSSRVDLAAMPALAREIMQPTQTADGAIARPFTLLPGGLGGI